MPRNARPQRYRDTWRIRWIDEQGHRQCELHADHKQAVFRPREHQQHVEEVRRGLREPTAAKRTFTEVCDLWIERRLPRKRSPKDDRSVIRKHLRPSMR